MVSMRVMQVDIREHRVEVRREDQGINTPGVAGSHCVSGQAAF